MLERCLSALEGGAECAAFGSGLSAAMSIFQALRPGDHVCLVGNTLAERMQDFGWLETRLVSRFPEHDLVFRNLGYSADELTVRLRSMDFGTPTKLRYARQVAAALGFIGLVNMDRVTVEAVGSKELNRSPVYRGRQSLWRMLAFLDGVRPGQLHGIHQHPAEVHEIQGTGIVNALAATEPEEPPREPGPVEGGLVDQPEAAGRVEIGGALTGGVEQLGRLPGDGAQQVVQAVGDAGGHLAEEAHPLVVDDGPVGGRR